MDKKTITEMMLRQADSLVVMAAAMMDYSVDEGDEWHIHAAEVIAAAEHVRQWVEMIGEEE